MQLPTIEQTKVLLPTSLISIHQPPSACTPRDKETDPTLVGAAVMMPGPPPGNDVCFCVTHLYIRSQKRSAQMRCARLRLLGVVLQCPKAASSREIRSGGRQERQSSPTARVGGIAGWVAPKDREVLEKKQRPATNLATWRCRYESGGMGGTMHLSGAPCLFPL